MKIINFEKRSSFINMIIDVDGDIYGGILIKEKTKDE
jgi:hypothetical protein